MLSHLRFHRRGASNPASPTPDHQQHGLSPLSSHEPLGAPESASSADAPPLSSSPSALPPTLPPIARVTSADADLGHGGASDSDAPSPPDTRPWPPPPHQQQQSSPRLPPYNGESRFIGGVALQNYRRGPDAEDPTSRQRPTPASATASADWPSPRTYTKPTSSFSTPTELHNSAVAPAVAPAAVVGRRTAGTRLAHEAPLLSSASGSAEPQKGKKGLPFLRNPMSTLLMRRKNNQSAPDLLPLPLASRGEEPAYDPRIRGTRVHDFSAPRRKQNTSGRSGSRPDAAAAGQDKRPRPPPEVKDAQEPAGSQQARNASSSDSARSGSLATTSQPIDQSPSDSSGKAKASSVDHVLALVVGNPAPPVPPKDQPASSSSQRGPDSAASPPTVPENAQQLPRKDPSTRTTRSRNISLSDISALPKHMKSTSSRFSFDMVGAAKQEKLLEEKHRQRELERQSTGINNRRDSRFDDLDDDAFDYDAMVDDGGLEEKIPGVNADLEDDDEALDNELDPDNDQENFAGFVFQRSNPSSLASPQSAGVVATPRDADGKVIGFAVTKDTPRVETFALSPEPQPLSLDRTLGREAPGLGIRAPCMPGSAGRPRRSEDDLYFDDGVIDLEGGLAEDLAAEPDADAEPFDESIFDMNDTDQFGRPVPGAFAQAQSLRRAVNQDAAAKRESDMTSRFSAHSVLSRSTAHTSPSVDAHKDDEGLDKALPDARGGSGEGGGARLADVERQDSVAAYQAALAAAAHMAAASGKFERSSSPGPRGEESPSPPGSPGSGAGQDEHDEPSDDVGPGYVDLDDMDADDDAIIAEANASALASDSDGWYGQEFGFYSAPAGQHHGSHSSSWSSSSEFEYANGGVFGPKGMGGLDRSTSGRMVSREPNLTPITERSEYSNRNSLMSLGFPQLSSSTPMVQSPGLAQLAMMADRGDEQMTLSALLRLRNRAWGGSQGSPASSREGSPRSERGDTGSSPWGAGSAGPAGGAGGGHGRKNSVFSTASRDSEAASLSGSPTLTVSCPTFASLAPATAVEQGASLAEPRPMYWEDGRLSGEANETTALSAASGRSSGELAWGGEGMGVSLRRTGKGHHRHKSSADSVTYLKEEESGETRWVMERRRTAESGQVEILEREVVEGGRI